MHKAGREQIARLIRRFSLSKLKNGSQKNRDKANHLHGLVIWFYWPAKLAFLLVLTETITSQKVLGAGGLKASVAPKRSLRSEGASLPVGCLADSE